MVAQHTAPQYQLPIITMPSQRGETIQAVNLRNLHRELQVGRDYSQYGSLNDDNGSDVEGRKRWIALSPNVVAAHLAFDAARVAPVPA